MCVLPQVIYIKQGKQDGWVRDNIYILFLGRSSQESSGTEFGNAGQESARGFRALHQDGGMEFLLVR